MQGHSNFYADWTPVAWTPALEKLYNSMKNGYNPALGSSKYESIRLFQYGNRNHFWVDHGHNRIAIAKMLEVEIVMARWWEPKRPETEGA
jgi:hypothetical protein